MTSVLFGFKLIKMETAADRIVSSIIRDIFDGRYHEGDALPSERDLALHFDVYRGSVREALKLLEELGLVDIQSKGKTRVRPFWTKGGLELLPVILKPDIFKLLPMESFVHILILRKIIWGTISEIAAVKSTEKDISRLKKQADNFPDAALDPKGYLERDLNFFEDLSMITAAPVLIWAINSIKPLYRSLIPFFVKYLDLGSNPGFYTTLIDLLAQNESIKARNMVLGKIDKADSRIMELIKKEMSTDT